MNITKNQTTIENKIQQQKKNDLLQRKTQIHLQYTLTWACSGNKPHTYASDVPEEKQERNWQQWNSTISYYQNNVTHM